jgi:predicted Zn finger-like uncharacterized protein
MYTYCPHCFSIYQVTPDHLDQAGGQLHCGECQQVYRAIDYLFEDIAAARSVVETQRAAGAQSEEVSNRYAHLDILEHDEETGETRRYLQTQPDAAWIAKDRSSRLSMYEEANLTTVINKIGGIA